MIPELYLSPFKKSAVTDENCSQLHGDAYAVAQEKGISDIRLSISYSHEAAVAVALAVKGFCKES